MQELRCDQIPGSINSSLYGLFVKDQFNYDSFIFKIPYKSRFCLLSEWRNGSDHPPLLRFSNPGGKYITVEEIEKLPDGTYWWNMGSWVINLAVDY